MYVDSGNVVFSLFLVRKVIDCVHHEIMLSKLNTCGVRGVANLDGFRSYLTNREQYVSIKNLDSNPRVIQRVFRKNLFSKLFYF